MDIEKIQSDLAVMLGGKYLIQTEFGGLNVWQLEPYYLQVLCVGKPPKSYDANWIINKINSKEKQSEEMKVRRKAIISKMHEDLKARGIHDFAAYETTFGFSVCNLFQDGIKVARECIEKCGIQYKKIEYSEAHWVVRVFL
jgi:hypothetical protein